MHDTWLSKLNSCNLFTNKHTFIKDVKLEDMVQIAAKHVIIAKTMIAVESSQENATTQAALTQILIHHYV